jgi:tetratricopeptide (TPR) repeat protein
VVTPRVVAADEVELAADEISHFWESALHPRTAPYDQLVARAEAELGAQAVQVPLVLSLASEAIALVPTASPAYVARARGHELAGHWSECAQDFAQAQAMGDADPDVARRQGRCLIQQGSVNLGIDVLATLAASGRADARAWYDLGTAHMASGRLEEAQVDFARSAEAAQEKRPCVHSRGIASESCRAMGVALLALAVSHDRARQIFEAAQLLARLAELPRGTTALDDRESWFFPDEDRLYFAALAADHAGYRGAALVRYRQFLVAAHSSQWARRAREHIEELRRTPWQERGPSALVARSPVMAAVQRHIAAMDRCLDLAPTELFEVRIVRSEPGADRAAPDQVPRSGATVNRVGSIEANADTARAADCVKQAAAQVKLPRPPSGRWNDITFQVVSTRPAPVQ